jgi:lysine decarboxylase
MAKITIRTKHEEPTLTAFLASHAAQNPVSFHMQGHKGFAFYERLGFGNFLSGLADCDITEITGADNLFRAQGVLADLGARYAALYGVRHSRMLVNGSSGGILAAMLAVVPRGGKLIMARNSHKSAFNALTLGDVAPVYAYPDADYAGGIAGPIRADEIARLISEHPDAAAVMLPSPNYYGVCSDCAAIADVAHRAGMILIVDQAHGAHLRFFEREHPGFLPQSAESAGADISVNSTHKTLGSWTQSAVMNVQSDRVDMDAIDDKLQCVETTSPSYALMSTLDINAQILERHRSALMDEWRRNIEYFHKTSRNVRGLRVLAPKDGYDCTKIVFSLSRSGCEIKRTLEDVYGVYPELHSGDLVMCMTGVGNTRAHYRRLVSALRGISAAARDSDKPNGPNNPQCVRTQAPRADAAAASCWNNRNETRPVPRKTECVPLGKAAGRVCAQSLVPYPPGIPLICPGEIFTRQTIDCVRAFRADAVAVLGIVNGDAVRVGTDDD